VQVTVVSLFLTGVGMTRFKIATAGVAAICRAADESESQSQRKVIGRRSQQRAMRPIVQV
jgi:hypothetical protein